MTGQLNEGGYLNLDFLQYDQIRKCNEFIKKHDIKFAFINWINKLSYKGSKHI